MSNLKDTNPDVYEFINSTENGPFANSIGGFFRRNGFITIRQLDACKKILSTKKKSSYEERKTLPDSELKIVLDTAFGNGLNNPKLRISNYEFSRAKNTSSNPGAVYVSKEGTYIGKIVKMNYSSSGNVDSSTRAEVEEIMNSRDILKLAVAYGVKTGMCSCCGRTLTNEESIELGIGPICRNNFGF